MAELNNPLLQQVEDRIEGGITPENRANYMKVVVAGMHILLANGANGFMAKLTKSKDPIADCAKGAVALVLIMKKQSRGIMPMKAAVPAAMTLMLKGLDFIDRSKIAPIGNPELVRATHIFTDFMFQRNGITTAGLQHAAVRVHAITQDPEAMAKINLKAGFTQHPMAAKPTPLPPGPAGQMPPRGLMNGPQTSLSG